MISRSNNALRLVLLVGMLFLTPVFFSSGTATAAEIVDINRADVATMIANWKGIGEKKAKAIVAYRKKNGAFKSLDDLANVKGIGEGLIKKNRKYMSVKGGIKTAKKPATTKKKKPSTKKSSTKKSTTKKSTTKKKPTTKKSSSKKSKSSSKSTTKK